VNDLKSTGAYRYHYRSRTDHTRSANIRYGICDSCRGIFQSLEIEARSMGFGSYTVRYPTLDETLNFNRENENLRRKFRLAISRCQCDISGDELYLDHDNGFSEVNLRQEDYSRPDVPADGWYIDPSGDHKLRYWDGANWTGYIADDGAAVLNPIVVPNNWSRLLPGGTVATSANPPKSSSVRKITKSSKSLTDQLAELTQLHNSGALTREQFEAAKNSLLGLS
jgi:hypothetical protein